ncbi:T9SS type A sorting domain-containing protein [Flavobacteriales bacterium]|nr:T9SS type A sorting domain-containing protein [Flavobacteriales bacterium]
MKKLLLILLCLPMIGLGQKNYVPDDNFEAWCEFHGYGDNIPNNDSISTINASFATLLPIDNVGISDLTGIMAFTGLTSLNCANNNLSSIDISFLGNNLTFLNVMGNPNLYCITVFDTAYAANNSAFFEESFTSYSTNCLTAGCTDSTALNFDSLATIDDGSCIYLNCIYSQIGQDIDGEEACGGTSGCDGDESGSSVSFSSDGSIVAIGAIYNSDGQNFGHVRIYENTSGSWSQIGQDIDGEAYDNYSGVVSLSSDGSTVAIGAPYNDGNGSNSGHVRIYENIGGSWSQIGQDIDGEAADDYSGGSVSLSSDGSTVAIGALENDGNNTNSGHVRIYENIGGTWSQIGQDIDGGAAYDYSGISVSLSSDGNTVAIGANGNDGNGSGAGHVRIYENTSGSWSQIGQDIDGEAAGDQSGWSVSLSSDGNTVAIGAQKNYGNGSDVGHVRIYENIGSSWSQLGQDIDGEASGDESGFSLSLSSDGHTVAIGAPYNDGNGTDAGHVRIYNFANTSACAGCTDPLALNYDSTVQYDDGSCIYPSGCTDPTAYNYDTIAITDDGSCLYCDLTNTMIVSQNTTGQCNGLIIANSTSSNSPITYLWSNGNTSTTLLGLCSGIYSVLITDSVGCIIEDTVYMGVTAGCTDPLATNYDPLATIDDGTCNYTTCGGITGVNLTDIIQDRVTFNWDNMNSSSCQVDQIRFRYREVGTNSYSTKTMGVPVGSGCNTSNISKLVLGLTPSTTYEYDFKLWYCNASSVNWHANGSFTTADVCVNATNMTATPNNTTQTQFCWDAPANPWSFVRLQYRENIAGSSFSNIGGFGVMSPALCKSKNGLTPATEYRVMWRTWCSLTGGPYRSPVWDGPVIWTQPTSIRIEGGTTIANLTIYPNPSRDIFNISFTSKDKQNLRVRILNVIGEELINENLEQFIGEYTKQINLSDNAKGIYFLEIETNDGIINKKLILQ